MKRKPPRPKRRKAVPTPMTRMCGDFLHLVFGVKPASVFGITRGSPRDAAFRHLATGMLHVEIGADEAEIAKAIGRTESTIAKSSRKLEDERADPNIDRAVSEIAAALNTVLVANAAFERASVGLNARSPRAEWMGVIAAVGKALRLSHGENPNSVHTLIAPVEASEDWILEDAAAEKRRAADAETAAKRKIAKQAHRDQVSMLLERSGLGDRDRTKQPSSAGPLLTHGPLRKMLGRLTFQPPEAEIDRTEKGPRAWVAAGPRQDGKRILRVIIARGGDKIAKDVMTAGRAALVAAGFRVVFTDVWKEPKGGWAVAFKVAEQNDVAEKTTHARAM